MVDAHGDAGERAAQSGRIGNVIVAIVAWTGRLWRSASLQQVARGLIEQGVADRVEINVLRIRVAVLVRLYVVAKRGSLVVEGLTGTRAIGRANVAARCVAVG